MAPQASTQNAKASGAGKIIKRKGREEETQEKEAAEDPGD